MVFASSSPRESYEVQRWVKFPVPSGQGGPFARAVDVRLDKVKEFVAHRFSWPEEWGESINGKKIQAFAARVVEVIILGPTMCVISCTLYFLPDRVARLVVNFFASPWVFLPEDCECRTFKEIAMIISTLVPAYLIGFFCNRIFVPILFKACSWVVNKAKFIKPIDSRFGVANILALFLVYIVAMRIQKNGKTIVCANRVGPFSNFFVADVGRHSGAVRVVLGRQFLVSYPALVLQEMGAYYRTYLDLGNSDRQSKQFEAMEGVLEYQNDNTRVIFQREKGRGQGITKNFFVSIVECLLRRNGGSYHSLFSLDLSTLRDKGYTGTVEEFYGDLGLLFGAMTRSVYGPSLRLFLSPGVALAIQEVSSSDIEAWRYDKDLANNESLLRRVGKKLFPSDSFEHPALVGADFEEVENLLGIAANVLELCSSMSRFYPTIHAEFSWDSFRDRDYFVQKLYGEEPQGQVVADRLSLQCAVKNGNVSQKIEWLKAWLKRAPTEQVESFLQFVSGDRTIKADVYEVHPVTRKYTKNQPIAARTCHHVILLPVEDVEGWDDTEEGFIGYVESVIAILPDDASEETFELE